MVIVAFTKRKDSPDDLKSPAASHDNYSEAVNANANYLKEKRLSDTAKQETKVGKAAAKIEQHMARTHEALALLGAGKEHGE